jgi:hypothetical protein
MRTSPALGSKIGSSFTTATSLKLLPTLSPHKALYVGGTSRRVACRIAIRSMASSWSKRVRARMRAGVHLRAGWRASARMAQGAPLRRRLTREGASPWAAQQLRARQKSIARMRAVAVHRRAARRRKRANSKRAPRSAQRRLRRQTRSARRAAAVECQPF